MHKLDIAAFRTTFDTGGILSVSLVGQGGSFHVVAETRRGEAVLTKARSVEMREFRDVQRATILLREIGISEFSVDTKNWRPEQAKIGRPTRPDRAKALRVAHEAAAYNVWLEGKVSASRRGLDEGTNLQIDQQDWDKLRAAKLAARAP